MCLYPLTFLFPKKRPLKIKHTNQKTLPTYYIKFNVVLEKTLESPLDCKEIQTVHPKGDQSWVFIGRTDAEAKTPILWPPHVKSWSLEKTLTLERGWGQEEKGMTEDEMAGWPHWLNGLEFEQALGVGDGQGGLACCSPWGHQELDMTEQLNWTELIRVLQKGGLDLGLGIY